jgi:hypothetical protein
MEAESEKPQQQKDGKNGPEHMPPFDVLRALAMEAQRARSLMQALVLGDGLGLGVAYRVQE